jgi:uncharacterized protein YegP (UPF0339 family)
MLDKGKTMDEIFEGRPMDFQSQVPEPVQRNGFIDTKELQDLTRHTTIYTSDLYRVIMKVDGVEGITRLVLYSGQQQLEIDASDKSEWTLKLLADHRPVLSPGNCNVIFFKNKLPFSINSRKATDRYLKGLADFNKSGKKPEELDQVIPQGRKLDLAEYKSVQYELPGAYYVGKNDVPGDAPPNRKIQSLQLQGYLLFYDRILADYFSQLSHILELFSLQKGSGQSHSYFAADLQGIPMLPSLLRGFQKQIPYSNNVKPYNGMKLAFEPAGINDAGNDSAQRIYASFYSREEAIRRLTVACNNSSLVPDIQETEEGRYYFILQDSNGTVFLKSHLYFDTTVDALRAAKDVIFMGRLPLCYQRNNEREKDEFSFDLVFHQTSYQEFIGDLNEPQPAFYERKDKFLNHLLARFSEDFTDYVLMMYALNGKKNEPLKTIEDKQDFLTAYPELSANRGKAFDYSLQQSRFPVSGLQKKVASLMGIHLYPGQSLNNFDIISLHGKWFFHFFSTDDKTDRMPLFESLSSYNSAEEASSACELFLKLAANIKNYRGYGCEDDKVHGFRVQSRAGSSIWINVQCTLSFLNGYQRNEAMKWMTCYMKNDGKCIKDILSQKGSYFIFRGKNNETLLKSVEGYVSKDATLQALFNCFPLLSDPQAWQIVEAGNTGRKIIVISDPSAESAYLARYPLSFVLPGPADSKMKELKAYFQQKYLAYKEDSLPTYTWLFNIDAMYPWQATRQFRIQNQLTASFVQFLESASDVKNYDYKKQDDNTWLLWLTREENIEIIEEASGAEEAVVKTLSNRDTILGNCVGGFSDEELVKQSVQTYAESINNLWLWFNKAIKEENAALFNFFDAMADNETLITTTVLVPVDHNGAERLNEMIRLAGNSSTLTIIISSPDENGCLYRVQLQDEYKQVLALSSEMNKENAEILQSKIISLSLRNALRWKKAEERKGYFIQLQTENSIDLLQGLFLFQSREDALQALAGWFIHYTQGSISSDHDTVRGYRYTVKADGESALGGLSGFQTPEERNARLHELENLIETLLKKYRLETEEAAEYFFSIKDGDEKIVLHEAESRQSLLDIQKDFYTACRIGKKREQYKKRDGCTFSFNLVDEERTLAIHPIEYSSARERDAAIERLTRFLTDHLAVTDIETSTGLYRYKWEWLSCAYKIETALESLEERTEEEQALDDMALILDCAKKIDFYKIIQKQEGKYEIYLFDGKTDSANRLACHPKSYNCKLRADEVIRQLVSHASFNLSQGIDAKKKFGADERLQPDDDKKQGFRLWEREFRMANYYRGFNSGAIRDAAARETWMRNKRSRPAYTSLDSGDSVIKETDDKYFFNLIARDGVLLWTSAKGYESSEEAKREFEIQHLEIIELSRDKSNFSSWEPGATAICLYAKNSRGGERIEIAAFKSEFSNREDFNEAVQERQMAAYFFPVYKEGRSYAFHLYNAGLKAYEWKGANKYPSLMEAWEAFKTFLELLEYAGNYHQEDRPSSGFYTVSLRKVLLDISFDPAVHGLLYPGSVAKGTTSQSDETLKQFLSLISQDEKMFYPFTDYANDCRYGLRLVNHNRYRVARFNSWYESITQREKERRKVFSEINCSKTGPVWLDCAGDCFPQPGLVDKEKIWRSPDLFPRGKEWELKSFTDESGQTYYCYQLNEVPEMIMDGNKCRVIWRSINHFTGESGYCDGIAEEQFLYIEILELATSASAYVYEPIPGKAQHYRLFLKDIDGEIVAEAPEIICGDIVKDKAVRMVNAMLYPVFKKDDGYSFAINRVCQEVDDRNTASYRYNTTWEGLQTFDTPDKAFDAFKYALTLFDDLRNYERADHSACGPFGIELVDPSQVIAIHPITYPDHTQRLAAMAEIEKAISSEGFHVLEHILLRPLQKEYKNSYLVIELSLNGGKGKQAIPLKIKADKVFESPDDFIKAISRAAEEKRIYIEKSDDRLLVSFWNASQELVASAQLIMNEDLAMKPGAPKKKTPGTSLNAEQVCKDITELLSGKGPKLQGASVYSEEESDLCNNKTSLLSLCPDEDPCVQLENTGQEEISCDPVFMVDPYSFRSTIVVPSWPRRFLLPRFREFFEKKLREEAPAHISLRIVWVSPADMYRFEKALSGWLKTLTRKDGCDYQSNLNGLVKVLEQIRNEYPAAQLSGDDTQQGFAAVLDEIILK